MTPKKTDGEKTDGGKGDGGKDGALRAMAAHRGFKLVKSRRRKPGGDFGHYGLKDADGEPVLGIDKDGLSASAEEIEAFLRDGMRATWTKSAGSAKRVKTPPAPKPPKPNPKPRFRPEVANLLAGLPAARRAEAFTAILSRPGIRLERIVSQGQSTPEGAPMVQALDEWVLLLEGEAKMRIEDSAEFSIGPGDHLLIAAGQKHWVTWTAKDRATVWLALHLD
jgi:mannose-6-phosphate isomerase-like protein (cupin superfamily)